MPRTETTPLSISVAFCTFPFCFSFPWHFPWEPGLQQYFEVQN